MTTLISSHHGIEMFMEDENSLISMLPKHLIPRQCRKICWVKKSQPFVGIILCSILHVVSRIGASISIHNTLMSNGYLHKIIGSAMALPAPPLATAQCRPCVTVQKSHDLQYSRIAAFQYMYIYMYMYISIHVCNYVHACMCVCTYAHVHMYVHRYMYICT